MWGASFPLALASVAARGQDPARLVGGVYAANTVGAIVGALCASLLLVAWIGSQHAQQVLIVVSMVSGLLVLEPVGSGEGSGEGSGDGKGLRSQIPGMVLVAVMIAIGALLIRSVHEVPGLLIAYGRYSATRVSQANEIIYKGEGMMASVAVSRLSNGVLNYHNAGKVQASSEPQDMRLQRMLGHLTTLLPPHEQDMMVIGFGAGATAGAVSIEPRLRSETIAEIEAARAQSGVHVLQRAQFRRRAKPEGAHPHRRCPPLPADHQGEVRRGDQRSAGSVGEGRGDALYAGILRRGQDPPEPGGVVTLFVQLYESSPEAVKSELATFFEAFPNGVVFGNTTNGEGYDTVLVGSVDPLHINVDAIQAKLASPEYARVAQSLREIGFNSAIELFSTFAGRASDLKPFLKDASVNRDRNLRLQYLAGLGLNVYQAGPIYAEMITYRGDPGDLFVGSEETLKALRAMIASPPLR